MTNLKRKRQEKRITQKKLSEKSGIKLRTIQNYEQGHRNIDKCEIDTLLVLADVLDCMPSDIVESASLRNKLYNLGW